MYYFKWTEKEITGLNEDNVETLYTEVNNKGDVLREIGVDEMGVVVHKCPSEGYKNGIYGIFDLAKVDFANMKEDASKEEFNALWITGTDPKGH